MDLIKNPLILLVDDNPDLLDSLQLLLVENNYQVKKGYNGVEALRILTENDEIPDLIISDIKMPEMNGYEFFQKVSNLPVYNQIPFIFLTGFSSDEEIKLGKLLGLDDYLTKPIKEEDLLAIVEGKIKRYNRTLQLENPINYERDEFGKGHEMDDSLEHQNLGAWLIFSIWDKKLGPKIEKFFPKDSSNEIRVHQVGNQCFKVAETIFGSKKNIKTEEDILFKLKNIKRDAYVYFGWIKNQNNQSDRTMYMLSVIFSDISYLDKMNLRKLFDKLNQNIKLRKDWDIQKYWYKVNQVLRD